MLMFLKQNRFRTDYRSIITLTHTHTPVSADLFMFKSHASVTAVIINKAICRFGSVRDSPQQQLSSARLSSALVTSRSFGSYRRLVRPVPGLVSALARLRGTTVAAVLRHHGQNASSRLRAAADTTCRLTPSGAEPHYNNRTHRDRNARQRLLIALMINMIILIVLLISNLTLSASLLRFSRASEVTHDAVT